MIDARHPEQIERLADVGWRAFLTGVGDGGETRLARFPKDAFKFRRWVSHFGRIKTDADDAVAMF